MYPNQPQQPGQTPQQPQGQPGSYPPQPPQTELPPQPARVPPTQLPGGYAAPEVPLTPEGMAPIDYLNQIAPQQKAPLFGFSRKQVLIAGGIVMLALFVFVVLAIMQGNRPSITTVSQQLVTRISATTFIAKQSKDSSRSRSLDVINGNLIIQLTNATTSLATSFESAGVTMTNARNAEADDTSAVMLSKLTDARLNGIFDRVYAREMSYRLMTILLQIDAVHSQIQSDNIKNSLSTVYNNIKPLQEQLAAYDATTSWHYQPHLFGNQFIAQPDQIKHLIIG